MGIIKVDLLTDESGTGSPSFPNGLRLPVVTQSKSSSYTILATDDFIFANPNGGAFTLTLPSALAYGAGQILRMLNTNSSALNFSAVTVNRAGSDTIVEGATTGLTSTTLVTSGEYLELESDGTSVWHVVKRTWFSGSISYSATPSQFTLTSSDFKFRRIAKDLMEVQGWMVINAVSGGEAQLSLPASLTANLPAIAAGQGFFAGFMSTNSGGGAQDVLAENGQSYLTFGGTPSLGTKQAGNAAFGPGGTYTFRAVVPITGW